MIRRAVLSGAALLVAFAAVAPATAQAPRSVVVPADSGVVIGPRGAGPRLAARPSAAPVTSLNESLAVRERASTAPATSGTGISPLTAGLAIALPLAALALLGSGIGDGGGNVSAPARTR